MTDVPDVRLSQVLETIYEEFGAEATLVEQWATGMQELQRIAGKVDITALHFLMSDEAKAMQRMLAKVMPKMESERLDDTENAKEPSPKDDALLAPSTTRAEDELVVLEMVGSVEHTLLNPHDDLCYALFGVRGCAAFMLRVRWLAFFTLIMSLVSKIWCDRFCPVVKKGETSGCEVPLWLQLWTFTSWVVALFFIVLMFGGLQITLLLRGLRTINTYYILAISLVNVLGNHISIKASQALDVWVYTPFYVVLPLAFTLISLGDALPGKMRILTCRYCSFFCVLYLLYMQVIFRLPGVEENEDNVIMWTAGAEVVTSSDLILKSCAVLALLLSRGFVSHMIDPEKLCYVKSNVYIRERRVSPLSHRHKGPASSHLVMSNVGKSHHSRSRSIIMPLIGGAIGFAAGVDHA